MFTGIVQCMAPVMQVTEAPGLKSFAVKLPWRLRFGLKNGASVSINGACHTVVKKRGRYVYFDSMQETLDLTNIDALIEGDLVNIERSMKANDEIGGHIMSGHVIGEGEITHVKESGENKVVTIKLKPEWMKYVFQKGFIGLDGCSLTIVDPDTKNHTLDVHLIPETLRMTTFGFKGIGDTVNVEIDPKIQAIVEAQRLANSY